MFKFFNKNKEKKFKLLLICGVSGCGKTYIEKLLRDNNSKDNEIFFNKLNQVTTRPARNQTEIDLKVYEFITEEKYNSIQNNLIAKTEVNGYHYGTIKKLLPMTKNKTVINTVIVNRLGYDNIKNDFKNNKDVEILTLEIVTNDSDLVLRNNRDIELEKLELDGIADLILYNNIGDRLNYDKVISALKEVKFIK